MEGRCEVCRTIRTKLSGVQSIAGPVRVCSGCESAVNRVAELEQREQHLVNALTMLAQAHPEARESAMAAVGSSVAPEVNRTAKLVEALQAFLRATHTSQGGYSGHTLEEIKKPGLPTQWACIMPGCSVCNARGVAELALGVTSSPAS